MHFHRTIFHNDPTLVEALGDTLIVAPAFGSYIHHGADNAPVMYDLFRSAKPEYDERPIATAVRGDGGGFVVTEIPGAVPVKGKKS